jgi:rare lipoprotein A
LIASGARARVSRASRTLGCLFALLLLAACASNPRKSASTAHQLPDAARAPTGSLAGEAPRPVDNPCAPTRVHRDSDYTPGGLYAPGVADGRPERAIDVSNVAEPVPRREPRAATGNRSPYTVLGKVYRVRDSSDGYVERGVASWYGTKFNGRATSSGETYDICSFTAAHRTLPLPSTVRVTNLDNGRSVVVRVNDRGPFHSGRLIDLSYAAAVRLGVDRTGTAHVELRALSPDGEPETRLVASSELPQPGQGGGGSVFVPPAGAGKRWVQVGSFADKDNAQRLAQRLRDADIDAVDLDHVEVDDRDLWRVRIGPVAGERLEALLANLRRLGLSNPRLVTP